MKAINEGQETTGDVTGKTTGTVLEPGLYESACCYEELLFERDDCFSRCPHCKQLCQWDLLQSVIPVADLNACSDESWADVHETEEVVTDVEPALETISA